MRRSSAGRRHTRPVPLEVPIGVGGVGDDDLTTWTSNALLETATLPGVVNDRFPTLVDVTNFINSAAKADTGALRFVRSDGLKLGHYRTASNRILVGAEFHGGKNTIRYYWGKAAATQPGVGFPSFSDVMASYRLALIFEGGSALDISPDPATFTITGTPTITTGLNGPAMQFGSGSYISTTAAKITSNARNNRTAFALTRIAADNNQTRVICWANWPISQRGFQMWVRPDGTELFISDEATGGLSYDRWALISTPRVGWNTIGVSWTANVAEATLVMNDVAQTVIHDLHAEVPGTIFNANTPYIIGGTLVSGFYHAGLIECVFELVNNFVSGNHMVVWSMAWGNANTFWGLEDRTPDNFDVPALSGQSLGSEATFAKKQITGMTAGTAVSVDGDGTPTYSIGSTSAIAADIKAKGSTDGTISDGNWLSTHHTTASTYASVVESTVTIGTGQATRKSTTLQAPETPPPTGGGGDGGIPTGAATVTVTNLAALKTAINAAKGGDIIEIPYGDYRSQGALGFSGRDFRGGPPLVIRASVRGYRGYLPTQGGLWVSGESYFTTGSRGAEMGGGMFKNNHNIVFDGIRFYQGKTTVGNWYSADFGGCSYLQFHYCKFSGYKPITAESTWVPYIGEKPYPNEWSYQGRGINLGRSLDRCDYFTFKHCIFQYHGSGLDVANTLGTTVEDCVFTDIAADHLRNDGAQRGFTLKRTIFYRQFPQQGTAADVDHPDAIQNTTKTQAGWQDHWIEDCIVSVGNGGHGKMQGFFYECDNYPQYPGGYNVTVKNCIMHSPTINTLYFRPADRIRIDTCTVLRDMGAKQAPDGQSQINFTANVSGGKSFGNNVIYRSVTDTTGTTTGDQITQSVRLLASDYEAQLVHYPGSWLKAGFTPVRILNPYTGVLDLTHLGYLAPKANSSIHPNQTGYHIGASKRFQDLGILP